MQVSKILKKIPVYTLILPAWILMLSCGKDDGIGGPQGRTPLRGNFGAQVDRYINANGCSKHPTIFRIEATSGYANNFSVEGYIKKGGLNSSGNVTNVFVGKTSNKDVMVLKRIVSGSTSAHEIELYFCHSARQIPQNRPIYGIAPRPSSQGCTSDGNPLWSPQCDPYNMPISISISLGRECSEGLGVITTADTYIVFNSWDGYWPISAQAVFYESPGQTCKYNL